MTIGKIYRVSGPLVVAEHMKGSMMYEVVEVGHERLIGEIIGIHGDKAFIQVYEDTTGLTIGEPVRSTGHLLSAELGPGLITNIFDGIQRPLPSIEVLIGPFIKRGVKKPALPRDKKWVFTPRKELKVNEKISSGTIIGYVRETPLVIHKIMIPPNISGKLTWLAPEGNYKVDDVVATVESNGNKIDIRLYQEWPVRKPRPIRKKISPEEPLITGIKIIDFLFPLAKGGKAAIPGGFGTGKCVLPGTPVLLADGTLKTIDEIFKEAKGKDPDLSLDEEYYELKRPLPIYGFNGYELKITYATHVYRGKTKKIIKIITSSGRIIEVTPLHKLLTLNRNGYIEEKEAYKITPDTHIIIPKELHIEVEPPEIPINKLNDHGDIVSRDEEVNKEVLLILRNIINEPELIRKLSKASGLKESTIKSLVHRNSKSLPLKLLTAINKVYGRKLIDNPKFLGLRRGRYVLKIPYHVNEDFAEFLGLLISNGMLSKKCLKFFSDDSLLRERFSELLLKVFGVKGRVKERGSNTCVEVCSSLLIKVLNAIGIPSGKDLKNTNIPTIIMKSPNEIIAAFLKGLYLGFKPFNRNNIIMFSLPSRRLLSELSYILTRLGIGFSVKLTNVENNLYITKPCEIRKFHQLILNGTTKLRKIRNLEVQSAGNCNLKEAKTLSNHYMLISQVINNSAKLLMHVTLDRVVNVEVLNKETIVYDLTVPETHNFVGGLIPVIFHNTVTLQELTKWSYANITIYVGCGERGNEMADALHSFLKLKDPRSGRPLIERSVFIANTSNMPVAAREASIYMGITIAEYFRDMGYDVLLVADSTSRWAEAMREISGRLEEMPGEEGFPAYLGSRIAEFYERAGRVITLGEPERTGSVTVVGAVSPPGADFSEPVTQNTLRYVRTLFALDVNLANRRHFPAINWLISYSLYVDEVSKWWSKVHPKWVELRMKTMEILQREAELSEIVRLVGPDALPEPDKLILEIAKMIREDFLFQSAYHPIDKHSPPERTVAMIETILMFYEYAKKAVEYGVPVSELRSLPVRYKIARMRDIPYEEFPEKIKKLKKEIEETFGKILRGS